MISGSMLHVPDTVEELLDLLSEHGEDATIVAGGTAFSILWESGLLRTGHLVSTRRIPDLDRIEVDAGVLRIGSAVPLADLERNHLVRTHLPAFAEALTLVANPRVRNSATIGGNLTEADPTSDPPCVLTALAAVLRLRSARGTRNVPISEFLVDYLTSSIEPDELLVQIDVPLPAADWHGSYVKFVSRSVDDRTCVGVSAWSSHDGTHCTGLRLAAIGVAPTPLRVPAAEATVKGKSLSDDVVAELADEYVAAADPVSDARGSADYRRHVLRSMVRRAVELSATGADQAVLV